jgi:thiol-disulfide isomerase/thioredoxin
MQVRWLPPLLSLLLALAACRDRGPTARKDAVDAAMPVPPADVFFADPLVGTVPPEWSVEDWMGSPPLTLAGLRGKVVLVRWLMGPLCPLCAATTASLRTFASDYGAHGLVVIGLYHHKEEAPLTRERYVKNVEKLAPSFPIALDRDWKTLRAWWLDGHEREYSSVSFLLDRQGRIRGIHPGGRYIPGDAAYDAMKRAIETLLDEEPVANR